MIRKINLAQQFATFSEQWSPRIAGDINEMQVKLAKFDGEFVWHHHEREDELFLVITGRLRLRLRDQEITLAPGEMVVIPRGVEHLPIGENCDVVLFEPKSTLNTGNVKNERTVANLKRLDG